MHVLIPENSGSLNDFQDMLCMIMAIVVPDLHVEPSDSVAELVDRVLF